MERTKYYETCIKESLLGREREHDIVVIKETAGYGHVRYIIYVCGFSVKAVDLESTVWDVLHKMTRSILTTGTCRDEVYF